MHRQLKKLGYTTHFDPKISVRHQVPEYRLTTSWFKERAYWQGVSDAVLERQLAPKGRLRRLRKIASLVKHPKEMAAMLHHNNDPEAFAAACRGLSKLGYVMANLYS